MPPINFNSAIAVAVAFALVARAFWPLIKVMVSPFAYRMMRGALVVSIVLILRTAYWDVLPLLMGDGWADLRDMLGGKSFSAAFNIPMLFAAYDFLHARLLLIPDEEQADWRWWNAWQHPSRLCIIRRRIK